jgi:hypothetical protein
LELFDVVMTTQLLARAQRQSAKDQAKRYPRVSREAGKLAAAVEVLLTATEAEQDMPIDRIWDLIEDVVPRAELRAAVALIHEVAPPGLDPEQEWQVALCARFPVAKKFVRALAETIEFGATADAASVLIALKGLPDLLEARPSKRGADRVPGRPAGRCRGGAGRMAQAGVHRGPAAGHGGPGRVHVLRAVAVPHPAQTAGHLRRVVVAVGRPALAAAGWRAVAGQAGDPAGVSGPS